MRIHTNPSEIKINSAMSYLFWECKGQMKCMKCYCFPSAGKMIDKIYVKKQEAFYFERLSSWKRLAFHQRQERITLSGPKILSVESVEDLELKIVTKIVTSVRPPYNPIFKFTFFREMFFLYEPPRMPLHLHCKRPDKDGLTYLSQHNKAICWAIVSWSYCHFSM